MDNTIFYANIYDIKNFDSLEPLFPKRFQRAKKFKFEADKLRSLAVSFLLYKELGIVESEIEYNEFGKPFVKNKPHFNISHSGDFTVLAVSEQPVGVDIELINPSHLDVAEQVFTKDELLYISENLNERFWILWTLKEATLKAIGQGLTPSLKDFSVLPLIKENAITLHSTTYYSKSLLEDGYALSITSASPTAPTFQKSF